MFRLQVPQFPRGLGLAQQIRPPAILFRTFRKLGVPHFGVLYNKDPTS